MKTIILSLLLLAILTAGAADRVILLEDFTNYQCSPCWSFEPDLNAFIDAHLATGDLAVIRVHVNWPGPNDPIYLANTPEQNARKGFYGINSVPTIKFDGVITSPTSSSGLTNSFNTRSAVPSYLDIFVARNGDDETGTVSIGLVAEQDLGAQTTLRLFATLVEDDIPGSGYWAGSFFEQAFRDNLFGPAGPVVEFSGPYPDTLYFEADYDITEWVNDNLYLVTFVQEYGADDKEVMNASYEKFMDLTTGIAGTSPEPVNPVLTAGPCPSTGNFSVAVTFDGREPASITVFDISGHTVETKIVFSGSSVDFTANESGIYFIRLTTKDGASVTKSIAVI